MEPISIYIHIPMCVKKCAYCDFTSFCGRMKQREAYTEAVCREMREQAAFFGARRVETVFFGGGTPTLMTGAQIGRMLDTLRSCFALAADAEITMEGNPGTLTRENLESCRAAGFDNLNLDLMLGLPGQTPEQWARTLSEAIALSPEHLSCYSLILEEGTPLYAQAEAGTCAPLPDEDALCEMDDITERLTRAGGYARYEVSNYAKAGRICRHNVVYWECLPYLGIGCAAHSDMDGTRFYNTEDFDAYLRGAPARTEDAGGRMFERMMMGLRMVRGVDEARFLRDFGRAPEAVWTKSLPRLMREGMLAREDGRLYLTARGMQVMNAVLVEMMEETEG